MTAREKVAAEVEAVTAAATVTPGPLAYVYFARGMFDIGTRDTAVTANNGELICIEGEDALTLKPHSASVALMVRLTISE